MPFGTEIAPSVMGRLSLSLMLIPFIPGVRDVPRWIPIYKLIWRDHYRGLGRSAPSPAPPASP